MAEGGLNSDEQQDQTAKNPCSTTEQKEQVKCLKCEIEFGFPNEKDDYLGHLYLRHKMVIADVEDIADLKKYLEYWVEEFKGHELEEYCTTMLLDQLPDGRPAKNEKYYLLSDILPKDDLLRKRIHYERLEKALQQHQYERTDRSFSKLCLHCRTVVTGLRADYLEHLFKKHFLQLGRPENLVYVDELIDVVQNKLENFICLFCEGVFRNRASLKEHMRKKGHKRINPDIKFYDKFFLINYKNEKVKNVKKVNSNNSRPYRLPTRNIKPKQPKTVRPESTSPTNCSILQQEIENDAEWSDWDGEKTVITCLFCAHQESDYNSLKTHMISAHEIDFDKEVAELTFYQKVKVVNYIRRQLETCKCPVCGENFENQQLLDDHLKQERHCGVGTRKQWDQPEFFFPTHEDDAILCYLDDTTNDFDTGGVVILPEEPKVSINPDAEALSLENFAY